MTLHEARAGIPEIRIKGIIFNAAGIMN